MTTRHDRAGDKLRRNRRAFAIERNELRQPSRPHTFPSGPVSAPIKQADAATRALIAAEMARRAGEEDAPCA